MTNSFKDWSSVTIRFPVTSRDLFFKEAGPSPHKPQGLRSDFSSLSVKISLVTTVRDDFLAGARPSAAAIKGEFIIPSIELRSTHCPSRPPVEVFNGRDGPADDNSIGRSRPEAST